MNDTIDLSLIAKKLLPLQQHDRYLAAFIFELTDPFIKVIVEGDNCINLSHLEIGNTTTGISFVSFGQFEDALKQRQQENRRPSMLTDCMIVFDKTGRLKELQEKYAATSPRSLPQEGHQMIRFTLLWADNKIRYAMANGDLLSASLSMHTNINDLLKVHYSLHAKWSKNDKRMLADLGIWDPVMHELLCVYLSEADVNNKFAIWTRMMKHILQPLGGVFTALENNCDCADCSRDFSLLVESQDKP